MPKQDILRQARHILVCGRSGQGKTSYAERYIAASHHGQVLIFDWQSEFYQRLKQPVFGEINFHELPRDELPRLCCFDPSLNYGGFFVEAFEQFCDASLYHAQHSSLDTLLVCDELQRLIPIQDPPGAFRNVLQTGRRAGLDTLIMSQQPNRLHNEVREQFTEIVFFKLTDERSLDFVEDRGVSPDIVRNLLPLHYLWFNTRTDETRTGSLRY